MIADLNTPSPWVVRWSREIQPAGRVLDLAAGSGRHSTYLASLDFEVLAVDRDISALCLLTSIAVQQADLESAAWPFDGEQFAAIVVTNYLHRPLFPHLIDALAPGGVLIYETFMLGNERYGRPSNPDFLLKPNELLMVAAGMEVCGFEQGYVAEPKLAMMQRICTRHTDTLRDCSIA